MVVVAADGVDFDRRCGGVVLVVLMSLVISMVVVGDGAVGACMWSWCRSWSCWWWCVRSGVGLVVSVVV